MIRRIVNDADYPVRNLSDANRLMMRHRTKEENMRNTEAAHAAAKVRVMSLNEKRRRARTRELKQAHASTAEQLMAEWLRQRGYSTCLQKAVDVYNIDIAIDDRIAIEIYGGGWHASGDHAARAPKRFDLLLSEGWLVFIVWVDGRHYPLMPGAADAIWTEIQTTSFPHVGRGRYVVLRGDGSEFVRGSNDVSMLNVKPPKVSSSDN